MRIFRTGFLSMVVAVLIGGSAIAQNLGTDGDVLSDAEPVNAIAVPAAQKTYQVTRPCIGAGYVPYSYPAVGSCPCGDDACFDPHRYYCCGKQYKRAWFHKWVGSHVGKRSMLDDYPCACIYPTAVPRPYLREVKPVVDHFPSAPPSTPTDTESSE